MQITQNTESLIQEHWKNYELLQMDAILFDSGKVLVLPAGNLVAETKKELTLVPIEETTVEKIVEKDPDCWIETVPYTTYAVDKASGDHILCGEGVMGNEGFVARVDATHKTLVWGMFLTFSNPFERVEIDGDTVWAFSTHGHKWAIGLDYPGSVKIEL